jgi:hypothetical protein
MATATYDLIASQTLASAAASITFSSIAATYTDLRVILSATYASPDSPRLRFNSTSTGYSRTFIGGQGSSASSDLGVNESSIFLGDSGTYGILGSSTIPDLTTIDIFSYTGSTYKTILSTTSCDKNGTGFTISYVALWQNTAAINTILLATTSGNNYNTGTVASLYGIKSA